MTSDSTAAATPGRTALSLSHGGPLYRLERRLRLDPGAATLRLIAFVVAVAWLPFMLFATLELLLGRATPMSGELGVHVRLLVALPLLLFAEEVAERRAASVTGRLVPLGIIAPAGRARWSSTLATAERLRASTTIELLLVIGAYAFVFAGASGVVPEAALRWSAPALRHIGAHGLSSLSTLWVLLVAMPLLFVLTLRFLWRWALWAWVLSRFASCAPHLQASHPDRAGGVRFLIDVTDAVRVFVLGTSCALASTWMDEIRATGIKAASFAPYFVAFIAFVLVLALGPYVSLWPVMFRAKRRGGEAYGRLARAYVDRFDDRWIARRDPQDLLGHPDFSGLADLGTGVATVGEMRTVPFSHRHAIEIMTVAALPIVPLVLLNVPATEIAKRVLEMLL